MTVPESGEGFGPAEEQQSVVAPQQTQQAPAPAAQQTPQAIPYERFQEVIHTNQQLKGQVTEAVQALQQMRQQLAGIGGAQQQPAQDVEAFWEEVAKDPFTWQEKLQTTAVQKAKQELFNDLYQQQVASQYAAEAIETTVQKFPQFNTPELKQALDTHARRLDSFLPQQYSIQQVYEAAAQELSSLLGPAKGQPRPAAPYAEPGNSNFIPETGETDNFQKAYQAKDVTAMLAERQKRLLSK